MTLSMSHQTPIRQNIFIFCFSGQVSDILHLYLIANEEVTRECQTQSCSLALNSLNCNFTAKVHLSLVQL